MTCEVDSEYTSRRLFDEALFGISFSCFLELSNADYFIFFAGIGPITNSLYKLSGRLIFAA